MTATHTPTPWEPAEMNYNRSTTMKTLALAILVTLCAVAHADELVINQDGVETLYEGTIQHLETDGLAGEVRFITTGRPSVGSFSSQPPETSAPWHVIIAPRVAKQTGPGSYGSEWFGDCYGVTAYTSDHGARVVLTCSP